MFLLFLLPLLLSGIALAAPASTPSASVSISILPNSTVATTSIPTTIIIEEPASTPEPPIKPLAIFTVHSFTAFIASPSPSASPLSNPNSSPSEYSPFVPLSSLQSKQPLSTISFQLIDSRPAFALTVTCTLSGPTIYKPLFTACDGGMSHGAKFRVSEGEVEIKREWHDRAWITGFAPQGTYWVEGEGGNVTKTEEGKTYSRTEPWEFPVKSAMANW